LKENHLDAEFVQHFNAQKTLILSCKTIFGGPFGDSARIMNKKEQRYHQENVYFRSNTPSTSVFGKETLMAAGRIDCRAMGSSVHISQADVPIVNRITCCFVIVF
jgi:hypothetical protein